VSPLLVAVPDRPPATAPRLLVLDRDPARGWAVARALRDEAIVIRRRSMAIERVREVAPDLVLANSAVIDPQLGFVRALACGSGDAPPIPVIVSFDHDRRDERLRALRCGVADCFVWRGGDEEPLARVRAQLHRAQSVRVLWAASYRDALTGLLNRRGLLDLLRREVERAVRNMEPLALLFIDLDGFKLVNDRCGHDVGDLLLQHIGALLASEVRAGDAVARLGGDEFVVVLPRRDAAGSRSLAARIEQRLSRDPHHEQLRASVGVSTLEYPVGSDSAEALLARADRAMYAQKAIRRQAP
jgi:diguanylate cyclase (GGDEF)-like protein